MKTVKRTTTDIQTDDITNTNKYFNQMEFKGIQEDENIYTTDQEALRDANNVYVDDDERLVSRPTLQRNNDFPEGVVPEGFHIVDMKKVGDGTLYVSEQFIEHYDTRYSQPTPSHFKFKIVNLTYYKNGQMYSKKLYTTYHQRISTYNNYYEDGSNNLYGADINSEDFANLNLVPVNYIEFEFRADGNHEDYTYKATDWEEFNGYFAADQHKCWKTVSDDDDFVCGFKLKTQGWQTTKAVTSPLCPDVSVTGNTGNAYRTNSVRQLNFWGKCENPNAKVAIVNVNLISGFMTIAIADEIYWKTDIPLEVIKYKTYVYQNYIIVFSNMGAVILDINDTKGWCPLSDYADTPIVKRVIGSTVTTYEKNQLTNSYKEQYIYSKDSQIATPYRNKVVGVEITSPNGNLSYTYDKVGYHEEDKAKRNGEIGINDLATQVVKVLPGPTDNQSYRYSIKKGVIVRVASGGYEYFEISVDGGNHYDRVYYPFGPEEQYIFIGGQLSEDGNYVFVVTSAGVYHCNVGDYTWSEKEALEGMPWGADLIQFTALTSDKFALFVGRIVTTPGSFTFSRRLYFKGPGLFGTGQKYTDAGKKIGYIDGANYRMEDTDPTYASFDSLCLGIRDLAKDGAERIKMCMTKGWQGEEACAIVILADSNRDTNLATEKYSTVIVVLGGNNPLQSDRILSLYDNSNLNIGGIHELKYVTELDSAITTKLPNFKSVDYVLNMSIITGSQSDIDVNTDALNLPWNSKDNGRYWSWFAEVRQVGIYTTSVNDGKRSIPLSYNGMSRQSLPIARFDFASKAIGTYDSYIPVRTSNAYIQVRAGSYNSLSSNIAASRLAILPRNHSSGDWYWVPEIYNESLNTTIGTYHHQIIADGDYYYFITDDYSIITNNLGNNDLATLTYTFKDETPYTQLPDVTYSDTEFYLAFGNQLNITQNSTVDGKTYLNVPEINNQTFTDRITGMINISTTELAIFFENKIVICQKVTDENMPGGYRYDYYTTKLSTGVRTGDSIINTLEGANTIFPTRRGLAAMNYQAFMATSDQVLSYLSDKIKNLWTEFYDNSEVIKIIQHRTKLILVNGTGTMLIYDLSKGTWWRWTLPTKTLDIFTDQVQLSMIDQDKLTFKDTEARYMDFSESGENLPINWFVMSEPLHMKASNYYKNLKQLVFQFYDATETNKEKTIQAQIKLYRKKITLRDPETIAFTIDNLRTFVKRFNYWKINEVQWALANDTETAIPTKLELNGISVKYELGEEVR